MELLAAPGVLSAVVIVVLSVVLAIGGVAIVRWRVHFSVLKQDHEIAGFLFSVVGVVYGVLLGFVTVVVWEEYRDTQRYVHDEAVRLSNLLRDSWGFPAGVKIELHDRLVAYGQTVVSDEWKMMAKGRASPIASRAYERIWEAVYEAQPESQREIAFYREALGRLNDLGAIRRSRLLSSQSTLPSLLWVLLVGGALINIAFTYMFGAKNGWSHVLLSGSLAGLIGFILFLILALSSPFSGTLAIRPEALEGLLQSSHAQLLAEQDGRELRRAATVTRGDAR